MIRRIFGAPLGGTTRGGHHGVDSGAVCLITPPNLGGGGGSCSPLIVLVALGEPGVPVICSAGAEHSVAMMAATIIAYARMYWCGFMFAPRFACPFQG